MNPRLIRVVVSQFEQMQGLRLVAAGVMLALFSWVESLAHTDPIDREVRGLAMCIPIVFSAWARPALRDYYARRFGRVVNGETAWGPELLFLTWIFAVFVLSSLPRAMAPLWMAWAAYPAYVTWTGWPYRAQHVFTAAAGVYVASSHLSLAGLVSESQVFRETWLLAAALIAAGLLDHLVLVRALPRSTDAVAPDEA
jgi:hypothetical protein